MAISNLLGRLLCPMSSNMAQRLGKLHRLRLAAGLKHLVGSEVSNLTSVEIMYPS